VIKKQQKEYKLLRLKKDRMIKTIINKFLKATLDELFIDAGNVQISMGADLFSESSIQFKDLTFRPDLFDICLQPIRLISGHLGKLSVDGIAELAFGAGKIRCQIENVFLLFGVDESADAEQVYIYTFIHTYLNIYIHIYTYICTFMHTYIHPIIWYG
jgi:hypothetical protein